MIVRHKTYESTASIRTCTIIAQLRYIAVWTQPTKSFPLDDNLIVHFIATFTGLLLDALYNHLKNGSTIGSKKMYLIYHY